jgi:hypothetical protein
LAQGGEYGEGLKVAAAAAGLSFPKLESEARRLMKAQAKARELKKAADKRAAAQKKAARSKGGKEKAER